jgi:GGDEF domain-containing protein
VARGIADRVLGAIGQPLVIDGQGACITGSIGVAIPLTDQTPLDALLRQADKALYLAKADGKACIRVYDPRPIQGGVLHVVPSPRSSSRAIAEV